MSWRAEPSNSQMTASCCAPKDATQTRIFVSHLTVAYKSD